MEENQFTLIPIGFISKQDNCQVISIQEKYCKALKHIHMFSHIIIVYTDDEHPNIFNTLLSQKVVQLKQADEKNGKLIIEGLNIQKNYQLYDIKPYFPNEDRVKNALVPNSQPNISLFRKLSKELGTILKIEGNYYLEIPNQFEKYTEALKGYSHIKIVWWFDKFDKTTYKNTLECQPPYENAPKTGIFASRSPVRPNPIAITTAKILDIDYERKRIKVSVLDCFHQTPLIGLSPYQPTTDCVVEYRLPRWVAHWSEWLDDREFKVGDDPILQDSAHQILMKYIGQQAEILPCSSDIYMNQEPLHYCDNGIVIQGAQQNNLKNIDVVIPYHKITVITGVSGSGKSSLAFDTIYAESQQRFMSSMSLMDKSQISLMEKPKVSQISGLPPAIAISQRNINRNPRSTVGTVTGLYDLLRNLYAIIGMRHCPECGRAIVKMTVEEIIQNLKLCQIGTLLKIKPFHYHYFAESIEVTEINNEVLDKIIRNAIIEGKGAIQVQVNNQDLLTFQTTEKCYHCDHILFELTASDFSFNNPESMCPVCKGLGTIIDIDPQLIVTKPDYSLLKGASPFWGDLEKFIKSPNANWMKGEVLGLANDLQIDLAIPWKELPDDFKYQAIYGTKGREVTFSYQNKNGRTGTITRPVEGAYHILKRLVQSTGLENQNALIKDFAVSKSCHCCKGERLKLESRLVTIADTRFPEVIKMSLEELQNWLKSLPNLLSRSEFDLAYPLLQELYLKLTDYTSIGLSYLTLDRIVPTLSGGEWQRLQLVSQLNNGLSHMLYILDEPTAGLHPKDYTKLMNIITKLKELHNTVIIVEHSRDIMLQADYIIDIGPYAGVLGGNLVAEGTPLEIMNNSNSETGQYLANRKVLRLHHQFHECQKDWVSIEGIQGNNLQNIHIRFPTKAMICITGVSGSGKSSLVNYGILPAVQASLDKTKKPNQKYKRVIGTDNIDQIVHITQSPIGRSTRSTPATYMGLMDEIRNLYIKTEAAIKQGYSLGQFSYNSKEGQCPVCHGYGYQKLDVTFMPTSKIECPLCKGTKFHMKTLQILYKEKNIAEVLDMSIMDALEFFKENQKIKHILEMLNDIGLGYIKLGQSSLTLSGGEAQRIKLAKQLNTNIKNRTLYLLDEPTTGLHFCDIQNLLNILEQIVNNGNTVILVEHNLDVIKNADWIIDLGPEGGQHGGQLVVQGTVSDIMNCSKSYTGQLLHVLKSSL